MGERAYKTMKKAGAYNIVLGVLLLVFGIACGIVSIIYGARLLRRKSDILF